VIVIFAMLGAGLVVGAGVTLVLRRWPMLDPGAPGGAVHTVGETVQAEVSEPSSSTFWGRRSDPSTVTGLALTAAVAVIIVGGGLLAALAAFVQSNRTLVRIDRGAANWGATNASTASTRVLRIVTQGGATVTVIVLAVVVVVVSFVRRRESTLAVAGFLALVVVGQNLIANVVKAVVDRARPTGHLLAGFSGPSFPSGHTTAAFATFSAIALVAGRGRPGPRQAILLGTALGAATLVGASRVLLGVHWLTDVIAGAALGLAWFAVAAVAFGGRLLRFGLPVEAGVRAADLETRNREALAGAAIPPFGDGGDRAHSPHADSPPYLGT
jgi:membrane-associated phospholipid phosphatase